MSRHLWETVAVLSRGRFVPAGGPVMVPVGHVASLLHAANPPTCIPHTHPTPLLPCWPDCRVLAVQVLGSHALPGMLAALRHAGALARLWPGTLLVCLLTVSARVCLALGRAAPRTLLHWCARCCHPLLYACSPFHIQCLIVSHLSTLNCSGVHPGRYHLPAGPPAVPGRRQPDHQ